MIDHGLIAPHAELAFPVEPVPDAEALVNEHCPECVEVSQAYGVRRGTDVKITDIVGHETALL